MENVYLGVDLHTSSLTIHQIARSQSGAITRTPQRSSLPDG